MVEQSILKLQVSNMLPNLYIKMIQLLKAVQKDNTYLWQAHVNYLKYELDVKFAATNRQLNLKAIKIQDFCNDSL